VPGFRAGHFLKMFLMERNTATTVSKLQVGDRFYKKSDKQRLVWEMVAGQMKATHFRHYHYWAQMDNMIRPQALDGKTPVVFLRHNDIKN
jgi:hypothetical protein